jgi:hypothetical protein
MAYGAEFEVAPGIHATFVDAGHILGSAIIRLRVADVDGGPEVRIVFSGDLGRTDTPILRDPTVVTDAEFVLVESTYGGREHEPEQEAIRILAETVRLVGESDGVLLVPSFAIGRTQEVVWELDRLLEAGKIPPLPLYLDSPMASKASDIYRHHPDYYDEETTRLLATEASPLDYPHQVVVNDFAQSQAIVRAPRPYMIVASNGMLTGGRVVGRLSGRRHARRASPGRRDDGEARRAGAPGPLPDPLDQRLQRSCRRIGAARLATQLRDRQAAGRRGVSASGLSRPWRSGRPGGARTEGPRARLRHPHPALAREGDARLSDGCGRRPSRPGAVEG